MTAEVARTQLRATGGDLLLAINMHMDGKTVDPDSETDDDVTEVGSTTGSSKRDKWQMESGSRSSSNIGNGGKFYCPATASVGGSLYLLIFFTAMDGPSCSVTNDEDLRAPIAPVTARLLEPAHGAEWEEPTYHQRHSAFDGLRNFAVEASK